MIFAAEAINRSFFPVLVPVGVMGNILFFCVSNQEFELYKNTAEGVFKSKSEIENQHRIYYWRQARNRAHGLHSKGTHD